MAGCLRGRLTSNVRPHENDIVALIPIEYEDFWARGERVHPEMRLRHRFVEAFAFGDSERMADDLAALVLQGTKRATASLAWSYEHEQEEQPKTGDLSLVTSWAKEPLCVIETTDVEVVPFNEVTEEFARAEGEDDGTLASWRRDHTEFFAGECLRLGHSPEERMLVVCERFRVAYQPQSAASAASQETST
jgi:uncharacterized protein YhfF